MYERRDNSGLQIAGEEIPPRPNGSRNENPPDLSFFALLREDFQTHRREWGSQGFWAIAVHRFGNWRMSIPLKVLRAPFSISYNLLAKLVQVFCGIQLDYTVKLGRRVRIDHFGGIILSARSIGNDVVLRQNTTLGIRNLQQLDGIPVIEDRVEIGCGACILGHVRIGHDSIIGANSVVTKDVPPHSVAAGIPARILR